MMKFLSSAPALALASVAALSLTVSPAMAREWHHRDRGIDGGDVLAGVLILGGIAAVASAASKSNREREARDYRYEDGRYPESGYPQGPYPDNSYPDSRSPTDQDYRDWRAQNDRNGGYAAPQGEVPYGDTDRRGAMSIDGAVDACTGEIERGERRIDSVDGVNRNGEGWRVEGRLEDGRTFTCTADADGRVRGATVDGRALI